MILGIVAELAMVPVRDCIPHSPEVDSRGSTASQQAQDSPSSSQAASALTQQEVLVRAIGVRAAFGGMAGDMHMLRGFVDLWHHRCVLIAAALA